MTDTVTVYHNGNALMIFRTVADDLGHHAGKHLTEAETREAIRANAAAGLAHCKLMIAAKQEKPQAP
jgi:hypothetical protein